MLNYLKPYAEYKESGLPWIGQVPKHWELKRLGSIFEERKEINRKNEVGEVLSVMKNIGVILYSEKGRVGNKKSDDISRYKIVRPEDIVLNSMNVIIGSVGMSKYTGCLSPVYYVLKRRNRNDNPKYLEYFFKNETFQKSLVRIGKGILSHRMRIPMELLKCELITLPPCDEQEQIVKYLDCIVEKIDKAIEAKKKLIALLNEQKQVIIHRAVTRGLDPNVKLKDSGIPWIGKIPEHWEVRRLRSIIKGKLKYGANFSAEFDNPDWPRYLRITDFDSDGILREETFRSLPPNVAKDYLVSPGDILFARSGATVGKTFLVTEDAKKACFAGYLIKANVNRDIAFPEFIYNFTQSSSFFLWKEITFNVATIQNIGADKYANLVVTLPPLDEQIEIVNGIKILLNPIETERGLINKQILLLSELKIRMIADLVTGKIDTNIVENNRGI